MRKPKPTSDVRLAVRCRWGLTTAQTPRVRRGGGKRVEVDSLVSVPLKIVD